MIKIIACLWILICAGCGVSWYVGDRPAPQQAPSQFSATSATTVLAPSAGTSPRRIGATYGAGVDAFFYATGTSGTYTVPAGAYVTSLSCHATGSSATLTITPSGPSIVGPIAGSPIPIPAGGAYSLSRPVLAGYANELGAGSVFVFTGTDAYVITLYLVGGP